LAFLKYFLVLFFIFFSLISFSQTEKRRDYFPLWTFDQPNIRIHGVSVGFLTDNTSLGITLTNGLRLELLGLGFLLPIMPMSPIANSPEDFELVSERGINQKVNGINLSLTGTVGSCHINGVTLGAMGQSHFRVNGITASFFMNFVQQQNGLMCAMFNDSYCMRGMQIGFSNDAYSANGVQVAALANYAEKMNGLQIALVNKTKDLDGIQIGLWNVNQKRKLPIVNWCFSCD
jgi:hypothetical protein